MSIEKKSPDWPVLAALALIAVAARLVLAALPLNAGEYTDGILQLTLFSKGNPYWPPLYSALAVGTGSLLGNLELGGRLVSALIGGLAILPLALLANRLAGRRAAIFAGIIFLVLPEPLRWGIRVMTDATFLTLFALSLLWMMPPEDEPSPANGRLIAATIVAILAALTRYQGMLLMLPLAWAIGQKLRARKPVTALVLAQLLWLAVPFWILRGGFAHLQQFSDRSGKSFGLTAGQTLLAYWNLAECYLYLFPYSLTPGVMAAFLLGFFSPAALGDRAARWFMAMFFVAGALVLAAQAAFGIFEFRYMMPMLAFVVPYAGIGLERMDLKLSRHRTAAVAAFALVLVPPMLFSISSLLLQRGAFGDLKTSSIQAAKLAGPTSRIFTNEQYNAHIPVVKAAFWAGRDVLPDPAFARFAQGDYSPAPVQEKFRPGDLVLFSTFYGGGAREAYFSYLNHFYQFRLVEEDVSSITPLLTDLMAEPPHTHGSPLAWFYRYQPEEMSTCILRIEQVRPL